MEARRNSRPISYTVIAIVAALVAAGAVWHRQHESSALAQSRTARPNDKDQAAAKEPSAPHAEDLAAEFRHAAREALPGMVSIETQSRVALRAGSGNPFDNQPALRQRSDDRQHEPEARVEGRASGFVIDRAGIILTSNHVVAHADAVKVKLCDGREFIATEFKGDPRTDVAIIRIKPEGHLHTLKLGNSEAIDIGDWVLAVGSPFGLDLTVTAGIISAKGCGPGITEREDFLQTDAAINPGNSGGPLVNLHGEVIGMNSAIATRSGGYEGIGFAVPINLARWVADQLISHGAVTRAYLGVGVQPIDQEMARQFKVAVGSGVIVTHVAPESPAAAAKLEAGDIIVRLDGKPVHSPRELMGDVEQLHVGHKAAVEVVRNGKDLKLEATVKELPHESRRPAGNQSQGEEPAQERKFGELGMAVGELNPELARQLGYRDAAGVAILAVEPGGIAAEAGLQEGMMIDKVGKHRVTTVAEFQAALKEQRLDEGILLLIRTPRGTQFVVLRKGRQH